LLEIYQKEYHRTSIATFNFPFHGGAKRSDFTVRRILRFLLF